MDQNIGRILQKIRDLGAEDNTLIVFLSDNGGCAEDINHTPAIPPGPVESYRSVDKPWAHASDTPFRKYKATDHEGGICTPFIVQWPGVIKEGGLITHQVSHLIDIMSTFADITGTTYPKIYQDRPVLPMEGRSLLPVLQGKSNGTERTLFWHVNPRRERAVRKGNWKLVAAGPDDPWYLYDMASDRVELNNLADANPQKVTELANLYAKWARRVGLVAE